jgi:hypothetical protein
MSEFLREQQRGNQVAEKQNGQHQCGACDGIELHGLPQLLAGLHICEGQGEEDDSEREHQQILHRGSHSSAGLSGEGFWTMDWYFNRRPGFTTGSAALEALLPLFKFDCASEGILLPKGFPKEYVRIIENRPIRDPAFK